MLAAGSLNRRITIQQQGPAQDAAGQPVDAWNPVATVWADVRHQRGLEAIRSDAPASTVQASIRIRHRTGLNAGMRVLFEGRSYNIAAVLPDARRVYIDLVCEVTA